MSLSVDFSYTDHTATFANLPTKNTLLTTMNVFADRQTSLSPKVSLDVLDEVAQKVSKSVNRYGSEWTATAKRQSSNHLIEAPLHAYADRITAADIQPFRAPGTDLQMSIVSAVTASSLAMYDKYMRTREKMFADALFRNTVEAEFTQQPLIDWTEEFSYEQATGQIQTGIALDPLRSIDDAVSATKLRMGGLAGQLDGFILFAGSNCYRGIKFHPDVRQSIQYGILDRDVLFNKEVLPGFSTFLLDNVRVVEVTDPLYGVGSDQAFLVPKFSKPLSSEIALPFGYVATASSRNLDLAFAEPVDFRIYSHQDKLRNVELFAESSILPVIYRPDFVTKLTNQAA